MPAFNSSSKGDKDAPAGPPRQRASDAIVLNAFLQPATSSVTLINEWSNESGDSSAFLPMLRLNYCKDTAWSSKYIRALQVQMGASKSPIFSDSGSHTTKHVNPERLLNMSLDIPVFSNVFSDSATNELS